MDWLINIYTVSLYQPFVNLFVVVDGWLPEAFSFGWTIILFALILRLVLIPLYGDSFASEEHRQGLQKALDEIEQEHPDDPLEQRSMMRKVMKDSAVSLGLWIAALVIQAIVLLAFTLLLQNDFGRLDELLYSVVTLIELPNFNWLGINLTEPHTAWAITAVVLIFAGTTVNALSGQTPFGRPSKGVQYVMPLIAFLALARLPAGVSLYVATTFAVSLLITGFKWLAGRVERTLAVLEEGMQAEEEAERQGEA